MSRLARELRAPAVASLLSVAAHVALSLLGAELAAEHGGPPARAQRGLAGRVPGDLGLVAVQGLAGDHAFMAASGRREGPRLELPQASALALPSGATGQTVAHPDTAVAGRGGDRRADVGAVNLADRDDGVRQTVVTRSHLELDQVHRRRSGPARSSREDARLLARPMELLLIGGGGAQARELLSAATFDRPARAGSEPPHAAAPAAGAAWEEAGQALVVPAAAGSWSGPGPAEAAGLAQPYAIEIRYRRWTSAGQPQGIEGAASAPASRRGTAQDTVSSLQQAHALRPRASLASGPGGVPGPGRGGAPGPGPPAAGGGSGPGFRSGPLGRVTGPYRGSPAVDRGRRSYLRGVAARVHPWWAGAFPRAAALEGRQGTVIVGFIIAADGSVPGAWVSRPSGIAEFDENCRRAVLRAAPFGPLPPELGPQLQVSLPFEFKNPAVRPPAPGDSG